VRDVVVSSQYGNAAINCRRECCEGTLHHVVFLYPTIWRAPRGPRPAILYLRVTGEEYFLCE
jgi:hypothetical protein